MGQIPKWDRGKERKNRDTGRKRVREGGRKEGEKREVREKEPVRYLT